MLLKSMKWTDDSGLPIEGSNWNGTLAGAVRYENLAEPVRFHPVQYKSILEVNDIFYRYELVESQYPDNSLWRVDLTRNGACRLTRFGGQGTVLATEDWFYGPTANWGYTKVGRYTGGASASATELQNWMAQYSAI